MSHVNLIEQSQRVYFIEKLKELLISYRGFSKSEKNYGLQNLNQLVGTKGELDLFVSKFYEKFSIDMKPFLIESKLIRG